MSSALGRDLRLIRLGITGEMRNPAFRLLALVLAAGAAAFAWRQGPMAASTALYLAVWGGRVIALACCLWFATGALRDQNAQLGAVLRSKPIDGARWVWINWATGVGLWLLVLAAGFAGAALAQLPAAGGLSLAAHTVGFFRGALIMVPLATIGYALTRATRSPLGATIVVLAFLCILAGLQLVPQFLRPDYTQNVGLYGGVALTLLALTGPVIERFRRGELRRPAGPILAVLGGALLAWGGGSYAYEAGKQPAEGTVGEMMRLQYLEKGKRVPGFWLSDGRGRTIRTAEHRGKILLIYLFGADDLEAARTLHALDQVQREFRSRGVQVIGVALSTDRGDGAALDWTSGFSFPIGSDPTTVKAGPNPDSALAEAYAAQSLPQLVVTDRRLQVQGVRSDYALDRDGLRSLIETRLQAEPE